MSDDDFLRVEANDCPMSSCAAPAGSPCRTGRGRVAAQYHTARFRIVPQLAKALSIPVPPLRKPGSARARGKSIGGAAVTDEAMLAVALHLRGQELSLRDIAARLVIATGKKKGQHPSPATVLRMLRDHDEKADAAAVLAGG
jgi:hypothetical protein